MLILEKNRIFAICGQATFGGLGYVALGTVFFIERLVMC